MAQRTQRSYVSWSQPSIGMRSRGVTSQATRIFKTVRKAPDRSLAGITEYYLVEPVAGFRSARGGSEAEPREAYFVFTNWVPEVGDFQQLPPAVFTAGGP